MKERFAMNHNGELLNDEEYYIENQIANIFGLKFCYYHLNDS